MVDELICNFLFRRHTLLAELERLTRKGWYLSEGFNVAPMLTSLVVGLYRGDVARAKRVRAGIVTPMPREKNGEEAGTQAYGRAFAKK